MDKTKVKGIFHQLVVPDVPEAIKYYASVYGFNLIGTLPGAPVYAMMHRDGFQVHFGKTDGDACFPNKKTRALAFDLYIVVSDIDRCLEDLEKSNADILEGIVKTPYGSREIVTRDCNGYIIVFGD